MALHQSRLPPNPQFVEVQRLCRELLRTAGLETLKLGHVTLHIVDFQVQEIEAHPAPTRVKLHRAE